MRTVSALDVRRRFGEMIDEAARGERIVIERAGQPIAAIVPLADLELVDPERRKVHRLAAIDSIVRLAREHPFERATDPAELIREQRRARDEQIERASRSAPS